MSKRHSSLPSRFFSWVFNTTKSSDRFGTPVSLNFNGETVFKTAAGGITSVFMFLFLIVYSVLLFKQMINRENSVINSVTKSDNLIYNPTKYNLADYNFIIGVLPQGTYSSTISDKSYFTLNISQVTQSKQYSRIRYLKVLIQAQAQSSSLLNIGTSTTTKQELEYVKCNDRFEKYIDHQLSTDLLLNTAL